MSDSLAIADAGKCMENMGTELPPTDSQAPMLPVVGSGPRSTRPMEVADQAPVENPEAGRGLTSQDRLLRVLGLFSLDRSEWTVEEAAQEQNLAISTAYRYFKSLSDAGLIVAYSTGRYVLGPAIIQYDRLMRLLDPLITTARTIMAEQVESLPPQHIMLLCRLYRKQVMCVHQEFIERPDFAVSYERGRPMPLFRGRLQRSFSLICPAAPSKESMIAIGMR